MRKAETWTQTEVPADAAEVPERLAAHTVDTEHTYPAAAAAAADLATAVKIVTLTTAQELCLVDSHCATVCSRNLRFRWQRSETDNDEEV